MTRADEYEETDTEALQLDYERARARSVERMSVHLADERLLRKPATKQGRRIAEQRERLRAEATRQLAGRGPYDCEVSVEIAVLAGEALQPPHARDAVKAYLDLLIELAYHDDSRSHTWPSPQRAGSPGHDRRDQALRLGASVGARDIANPAGLDRDRTGRTVDVRVRPRPPADRG